MFLFSLFGLSREISILLLAICAAAYFLIRRTILRKSIPADWSRWKIAPTERGRMGGA
jgi:hypothetical protein